MTAINWRAGQPDRRGPLTRRILSMAVMVALIVEACVTSLGTAPPARADDLGCTFTPTGLIAKTWAELRGRDSLYGNGGELGCATGPEAAVPGTSASRMPFERGAIVRSPDQGPNMTVAAYQVSDDLVVRWGNTSPFSYDKFIVRWSRDGGEASQADVSQYISRTDGFFTLRAPAELRQLRGAGIAMVFQDPATSLNPVFTVGSQLIPVLRVHQNLSRPDAHEAAVAALRAVEIRDPAGVLGAYPHELSGGMRQRVLIAMAIACQPRVLIADEPTSALDVTVQATVLDLVSDLVAGSQMSLLLITHDMGVVARLCSYVYVMYAGRVVEQGPVGELFRSARHPYTRALLQSTPRITGPKPRRLNAITSSGVPAPEALRAPGGTTPRAPPGRKPAAPSPRGARSPSSAACGSCRCSSRPGTRPRATAGLRCWPPDRGRRAR
jgi:ABC-type dipeptide/oligopeptide/nickel transport system ATPase component